MMRLTRQRWMFTVAFALLFLTGAANATLVVSRPGDPTGIPWTLGGEGQQALAVSWLQPTALSDVAINVYNLENLGGDVMPVLFGLREGSLSDDPTNPLEYIFTAVYNVGPGLTVADVALDFGGPVNLNYGTWFLTATTTGYGAWRNGNPAAPQVEDLGTFGPEYFAFGGPPWFSLPDVTLGYQVQTPEPATWMLMGGGLLLMGGLLRRRRS